MPQKLRVLVILALSLAAVMCFVLGLAVGRLMWPAWAAALLLAIIAAQLNYRWSRRG